MLRNLLPVSQVPVLKPSNFVCRWSLRQSSCDSTAEGVVERPKGVSNFFQNKNLQQLAGIFHDFATIMLGLLVSFSCIPRLLQQWQCPLLALTSVFWFFCLFVCGQNYCVFLTGSKFRILNPCAFRVGMNVYEMCQEWNLSHLRVGLGYLIVGVRQGAFSYWLKGKHKCFDCPWVLASTFVYFL